MITTFWQWFFRGTNGDAGFKLLIRWNLLIHALVALFLTYALATDPFVFAGKALFPAASILVSMAVAWTTRASAVLQDNTFRDKVISESNPLENYVYGYQLSLLLIMTMVTYVAIMAGGGLKITIISTYISIKLSAFFLYFLLSFSVTQCWQVIDFSNLLSLLHEKARKSK